jgi:hypothetical protein
VTPIVAGLNVSWSASPPTDGSNANSIDAPFLAAAPTMGSEHAFPGGSAPAPAAAAAPVSGSGVLAVGSAESSADRISISSCR